MVNRLTHPHKFFTGGEKERIVQAIRAAENKTSGEVRIFLEHKARGEIMNRAKKAFEKLAMTRTKHRNGVLIYFSLKDRSFALLGDQGIHEKVGDGFWRDIASKMKNHFSRDDFAGGLEAGIREVGERLKQHFPREAGDANELPDQIQE